MVILKIVLNYRFEWSIILVIGSWLFNQLVVVQSQTHVRHQ